MSRPDATTVTCPHCGQAQDFVAWNSLNATLDPERKAELLSGELTRLRCTHCRASCDVVHPLLYHDMKRRLMVHFLAGEAAPELSGLPLGAMLKDYRLRWVDSRHELIEKILLADANLDDQMMELFKVVVRVQMESDPGGELYFEEFGQDADGQDIVKFVQVTPRQACQVTTARQFFEKFAGGVGAVLQRETLAAGHWHRVNRAYAEALMKKYVPDPP